MRKLPQGPPIWVLLWIGFGGLIVLLIFAGVSALSIISDIQRRSEQIRSGYVQRSRVLNDLRANIYLSGTYVRDFLLEPDNGKAEVYRQDYTRTRERIETAIAEYRGMLHPEETSVFNDLGQELFDYFDALRPALHWDAAQRGRLGGSFMHDEVLRRRMTMISLADQVGQVNERQSEAGDRQVELLFRQFRRRFLWVLALTLAVGLILAGMSTSRILILERETRDRLRELTQARREARDLSARLVDTQEEERRSLSRELHDEVGQSLSALVVGLASLGRAGNGAGEHVLQEQIRPLRELAERTIAVVRNISLLLRPSMLDDLGLLPALQWQAREVSRSTAMRVSVAAEGIAEELPDEYKTCIYRVVQEALRNCQRHAQAQTVRIQLQQNQRELRLSIQDDGRGFLPGRDKGLGLLGIEERAQRLRGSFHIDSGEGRGTLLLLHLPLKVPEQQRS